MQDSPTGIAAFILAACALLANVEAKAAELVVNGSFETGDFSSWTTTDASLGSYYGVDNVGPTNGLFSAYFGGIGPTSDAIAQTLPTSVGEVYEISFWLGKGLATDADSSFVAILNEVPFFTATGNYTFQRINAVVTATGASSTLRFAAFNKQDFYTLDDVSVTRAVPEPAGYAFMALGLLVMMGWRRIRTRSMRPMSRAGVTDSGRCQRTGSALR